MKITKKSVEEFRCPRWSELPNLALYMDQVMVVIENAIGLFWAGEETLLTRSMINNYVKHKLIPAPQGKKYGKEHLADLIVLSIMKRVLSMSEISALLAYISKEKGGNISLAYDYFCDNLENFLASVFDGGEKSIAISACSQNPLNAALTALTGKLVLQDMLEMNKQS